MSEASEASSTFAAGQKPITLPDWLPSEVARQARSIEARCSSAEQHAILLRLATNTRMKTVWKELSRRNRSGGGFFHPAKWRLVKPEQTQDDIQADALGELFRFAFQAACDRVAVSKPEDGALLKANLHERARVLREIADDMAPMADPLAAVCALVLRRVADWQEDCVALLRPPSDPLTIQNDRGDRVVRGVQIIIAVWLRETFGKPLDGMAATLAAVALGQKTSERATRSAFVGRESARKSGLQKPRKRR